MTAKKVSTQDVKIKKGNAAFEKMTKAEKRVAICKDVLKHLWSGKINARKGRYFFNLQIDNEIDVLCSRYKNEELQTLLNPSEIECEVCAKGAMFIADILKNDNFLIGFKNCDINNDNIMVKRLKKYFTEPQLSLVETAFEQRNMMDEGVKNGLVQKAVSFGQAFDDHSFRLIAIMENIIKNKGTFKP